MGFIYQIRNIVTGDLYVGKTKKTLEERLMRHRYNSKYGIETHLYRAMRKYGTDKFVIESLIVCEDNSLNTEERKFIATLNPRYNMTMGGDGGNTTLVISEERKRYLQQKYSGSGNPMYGKRGPLNPNWGKKYGKKPKISQALSNPCICDGVQFDSITKAEEHYLGVCSVRKRLDNPNYPNWYRLVTKVKRTRTQN